MILIYAFSNQWGTNISHRVLLELQKNLNPVLSKKGEWGKIDYQLIRFHPLSFFEKYIKRNNYDLIIGLGDFWGDINRIKMETQAFNKYGDNSIDAFSPITLELSLPPVDLIDPQKFIIGEHMGTYNCNWIAFQIQKEINSHCPQTSQLFFHLPKKAKADFLAADIITLLKNNNLI